MTFADWRTLVKTAFQGGEPTRAALLRAVTDGARSVTMRDVESDLALARSYENSFRASKVKLAGTRLTGDIADIIVEVRALMPIDADTDAIAAMIENAITAAVDDLNGTADKWDAYLLQAAIDLQRHVPFYQVRQITTFLAGGEGVTTEGFVSRVPLPETARIQNLTYGHYYGALEADTDYAVDDIVVSNGRAYKVVTAGSVTAYEVADGLTSTDGTEETLGEMTFRYFVPEREWPVRQIDWNKRNQLMAGDAGVGPLYAFPPQCDEIWLFPALDADHRFDLEWVGVTEEFEDDDEVTFDRTAAEAAAHFIRAMLFQTEMDDTRQAAPSLTLFQRALRKAVIDCQARDTGSPTSVAPYDWRRRWRCCGVCGIVTENSNNAGDSMISNSENDQENVSGTAYVTAGASNHVERISFTSASTPRSVVLRTVRNDSHQSASGDRITIAATFETDGVEISLINSTPSGDEITTFTSEYAGQQARLEFSFTGGAWQFLPP